MLKLPIKALFVDFDGTLVDSIPKLKEIYYFFLKSEGREGSEEEFTYLNGRSLKEIAHYLSVVHEIPRKESETENLYRDLLAKFYVEEIPLFEGVLTFFQSAKKCALPIWIVTSASGSLVQKKIESEGIEVAGIISGEGLKKGKPDPEIYLNALKRAKLKSSEVAAVEDAENGIHAARAAKIQVFPFGLYSWSQIGEKLWG